jgi:hypothetical protein
VSVVVRCGRANRVAIVVESQFAVGFGGAAMVISAALFCVGAIVVIRGVFGGVWSSCNAKAFESLLVLPLESVAVAVKL